MAQQRVVLLLWLLFVTTTTITITTTTTTAAFQQKPLSQEFSSSTRCRQVPPKTMQSSWIIQPSHNGTSTHSGIFSPSSPSSRTGRRRSSSVRLDLATSSSELKKSQKQQQQQELLQERKETTTTGTQPSRRSSSYSLSQPSPPSSSSSLSSVAKRISLAANRALEKKKRREQKQKQQLLQQQHNERQQQESLRQDNDHNNKLQDYNNQETEDNDRTIVGDGATMDDDDDTSGPTTSTTMVSLQDLTHTIDERLRANQLSPDQFNRDSMTSVIRHNYYNKNQERGGAGGVLHHPAYHRGTTTTATTATSPLSLDNNSNTNNSTNHQTTTPLESTKVAGIDREVAIVLGKPLHEDVITVQYANRIRRLVRAMICNDEDDINGGDEYESNNGGGGSDDDGGSTAVPYRPDVICFVGPQSPGNMLVDADAGYMYFQYLTMAHGVSTDGIDIHLVKGLSVADGALQQIATFLQETCLPAWLRASHKAAEAQAAALSRQHGESPLSSDIIRRRHKLKVHFSLISSEYELCQLHDIHIRSPGQSVLRALESWSQRSFVTTWSYMYVTTVLPAADAANPGQAFCAKTYKTAQQLLPVVQNLRNVVHNREFFQTESYRVLVAARRSLVSDMETLYAHQPQLKAVRNWRQAGRRQHKQQQRSSSQHQQQVQQAHQGTNRPVDVVLEGALLLLGRCVDIVRPAGLLTGASVSLDDWKLALVVLRQAFVAITTVCNPDRPLYPEEWMTLDEEADATSTAVAADADKKLLKVRIKPCETFYKFWP